MFSCVSWDNTNTAYKYICGLVQAEKGNMERMEEEVADSEYQQYQQFISDSPWSSREVMNQVAIEASHLLKGTGTTGLLIDETYFQKKGVHSVGVSRQWNGRLGKVENSQVAVFAALSAGDRVCPIDTEFYLPEAWTDDPDRCRSKKVPEERLIYKTKLDLALDMVTRQRELGVEFDFICADGLYGNSGPFCRALDDANEVFVLHVHADQRVYLEDPDPHVPAKKSPQGRAPSKLTTSVPSVLVRDLVAQLDEREFTHLGQVRITTSGDLEIDAYRCEVWVWDGDEPEARKWTLFVRREVEGSGEIKYCLSNAPESTSILQLARWESQRFWIERTFEDGKQDASMADYQVRGWIAWHHHMALVMMAMLFMLRVRMTHAEDVPLLSCHDIRVLLSHFLQSRKTSTAEIIRQMDLRHKKRKSATEAKKRRQAAKARSSGEIPP